MNFRYFLSNHLLDISSWSHTFLPTLKPKPSPPLNIYLSIFVKREVLSLISLSLTLNTKSVTKSYSVNSTSLASVTSFLLPIAMPLH